MNPARPTMIREPRRAAHRRSGLTRTAYRGAVADSVVDAAGVAEDALIAVSERSAARLAGVTMRQLRYWAATGVVVPSLSETLSGRGRTRLYTFRDLLELFVAAELRSRFPLQHIRRVLRYLREAGYEHPLAELRFAVEGDQIYFQHPDGSWEGEHRPGQVVLSHVLLLDPLRDRIRAGVSRRDPVLRGQVVRRRKVLGSKPVFAGTRTPVAALFPYLERRRPTKEILESFPHLSVEDVRLARRQWRQAGAA